MHTQAWSSQADGRRIKEEGALVKQASEKASRNEILNPKLPPKGLQDVSDSHIYAPLSRFT